MSAQQVSTPKTDISTQVLKIIDKYQTIARSQPSSQGLYRVYMGEIEKLGLEKINPVLLVQIEQYAESDEFKRGGYVTSTVLDNEWESQKQFILRNKKPSGD